MPCFSSISTKITHAQRLADALKALGFDINVANEFSVSASKNGDRINFSRSTAKSTFSVTGDTSELVGISKKYAEIGVREFAKRNGYLVQSSDGTNVVLVNRR